MLEELLALGHKGAEYDAWLIRIGEGDQFGSGFVAINPNSKIPALVDRSGPTPIRVFETGAILMHLAEKFGEFLPTEPAARAECLSWLFWQMGSTPYVGGGFGHFYAYAPVKIEYAIDRFTMETKRLLDVLDKQLGRTTNTSPARDYTIADMAIWPWYGGLVKFGQYGATEFLARARIQERAALGRHALRTAGGEARAHGQPHSPATRRASCTSATTPATSRRRRRTSSPPRSKRRVFVPNPSPSGRCRVMPVQLVTSSKSDSRSGQRRGMGGPRRTRGRAPRARALRRQRSDLQPFRAAGAGRTGSHADQAHGLDVFRGDGVVAAEGRFRRKRPDRYRCQDDQGRRADHPCRAAEAPRRT